MNERAERVEKWHYIIASLIGGLGDEGVVKWLQLHVVEGDLDEAYEEAKRLRDGMIAT